MPSASIFSITFYANHSHLSSSVHSVLIYHSNLISVIYTFVCWLIITFVIWCVGVEFQIRWMIVFRIGIDSMMIVYWVCFIFILVVSLSRLFCSAGYFLCHKSRSVAIHVLILDWFSYTHYLQLCCSTNSAQQHFLIIAI